MVDTNHANLGLMCGLCSMLAASKEAWGRILNINYWLLVTVSH